MTLWWERWVRRVRRSFSSEGNSQRTARMNDDDSTVVCQVDTLDFFHPEEQRVLSRQQRRLLAMESITIKNPLATALCRALPFVILFPVVSYAIVHYTGVLEDKPSHDNNIWKPIASFNYRPARRAIALSTDGNALAIASPYADNECLQAYTLLKDDSVRLMGQELCPSTTDDQHFGVSMSFSHNATVLAVGVLPGVNDGNASSAYVRVFTYLDDSREWITLGNDIVIDTTDEINSTVLTTFMDLSLSSDGEVLVVGSNNDLAAVGQVHTYHYSSSRQDWLAMESLYGQESFGASVSLLQKDKELLLAAATSLFTVQLYHFDYLQDGWKLATPALQPHKERISTISLAVNNKDEIVVATGTYNGPALVHQWDGSWERLFTTEDGMATSLVALSRDAEHLVVGTLLRTHVYYNNNNQSVWEMYPDAQLHGSDNVAIANNKNKLRVATTGRPDGFSTVVNVYQHTPL